MDTLETLRTRLHNAEEVVDVKGLDGIAADAIAELVKAKAREADLRQSAKDAAAVARQWRRYAEWFAEALGAIADGSMTAAIGWLVKATGIEFGEGTRKTWYGLYQAIAKAALADAAAPNREQIEAKIERLERLEVHCVKLMAAIDAENSIREEPGMTRAKVDAIGGAMGQQDKARDAIRRELEVPITVIDVRADVANAHIRKAIEIFHPQSPAAISGGRHEPRAELTSCLFALLGTGQVRTPEQHTAVGKAVVAVCYVRTAEDVDAELNNLEAAGLSIFDCFGSDEPADEEAPANGAR